MFSQSFTKKIAGFISRHHLMDGKGKYIVALSGGADSVTLTLLLQQLGYDIEAAHCNFHLRGEESVRDEQFCKAFCQQHHIPLHVTHFDTITFAQLHKISIEMAARKLRYAYFNSLMNDLHATGICVGHHQDDSVETVLINLLRGTGIHGLKGIAPKNGHIIRPLLGVSRKEILAELDGMKQAYVTDSSNLCDDVVRNKIRLHVLPLLKTINPSADASIAKTAERLTEAARLVDECIANTALRATTTVPLPSSSPQCDAQQTRIDISVLLESASPETVLFHLINGYGFNADQTEQIYQLLSNISKDNNRAQGKLFVSSTHQLLIDRGFLLIEPIADKPHKPMRIPETGVYLFEHHKLTIKTLKKEEVNISRDKNMLYADLNKVSFPLTLRHIRQGDRFTPFGMKGSRLVSDYLTDRKINLFDKSRMPVLTDAQDQILWLVNERADNGLRITPTTTDVLVVRCDSPHLYSKHSQTNQNYQI